MRAVRWFSFIWICSASLSTAADNRTHVSLWTPLEVAVPGQTMTVGLHMRMEEGWHTYWKNPGEAGKSTEIAWTLPDGITAGEIQWPVPEKYNWSGLVNYVYHHETILLVPLKISPDMKPGPVTLQGKVDWLECEELCVPGRGEVSATVTIGVQEKPSAHQARLEAAKASLPRSGEGLDVRGWWDKEGDDGKRPVLLSWKKTSNATQFDFYPDGADTFMVQPAVELLPDASGRVVARKVVETFDGTWPATVTGLIVERDDGGKLVASHAVEVRVSANSAEGPQGVRSAPAGAGGEGVTGAASGEAAGLTLFKALALAFLGGMILNIMPCVLPVIALKILGFVNQSKETPGRVRVLGMIYALGVVCSFLVLALLVIGVKQAGSRASWGMQFGNPYFLVGITVLVMLVAMNLFGLFEVHLGSRTMGAASGLAARKGSGGAFFNGVLATALATPCTAPFLAPALGFALPQPAPVILLIFVAVALGLAAPYVVLSWNPSWLKYLPKPGPWMVRFKVAMGFPMLAAGIWLFSILERHYGQEGVLWIGLFLVSVAVAAWVFGEFVQRGVRRKAVAGALSVALLVGGYVVTMEGQLNWRDARAGASASNPRARGVEPGGIDWQPWSPEAVGKARREGRPVFVDFTADWCLTCKLNEKSSINIEPVREKLKAIDAVALLADNTLVLDEIAAELQKYGRAGVPLVLVYPKDGASPPMVLPAFLTPSIVIEALDKAARTTEAAQ